MDIVCLGIIVADVMGKPIEKMPEPGKLEIFDQMELHPGGCATNTSIGLAKLGVKTRIMGKVGRDSFADFILRILNDYKVDTSGIKQAEKRGTAFTFAAINKKGERGFFHYTGANEELTLEDIDFNLIKDSKILHIAGSYLMPQFDGEPTAKVLQKAKEYGVTTSLDTAWNSTVTHWQKIIEPCLSYLDIILPAIEEARMFTGKNREADIADYLLSYGLKVVGLKMGKKALILKVKKRKYIYLLIR